MKMVMELRVTENGWLVTIFVVIDFRTNDLYTKWACMQTMTLLLHRNKYVTWTVLNLLLTLKNYWNNSDVMSGLGVCLACMIEQAETSVCFRRPCLQQASQFVLLYLQCTLLEESRCSVGLRQYCSQASARWSHQSSAGKLEHHLDGHKSLNNMCILRDWPLITCDISYE